MFILDSQKGIFGGLLVFAFGVFIAGFLTGMLSIAVLQVTPDLTTLGLMIFAVGFVSGILAFAVVRVVLRQRRMRKPVEPR